MRFSENESLKIIDRAKEDKNYHSSTYYNLYVEVIYKVKDITCIQFPSWSNVSSISFKDGFYYIIIGIFKDSVWNLEITLKNGFITIIEDIEYNINRSLERSELTA
jgi:spermidine/putrescine-binding protein